MSPNIIWENKSVMLGIMLFLNKYRDELINTNIIIHDDLFRGITKKLFIDLNIKKKGKGFHVNIRNNVEEGLIINNILNLNEINNKNFYLLPWYDKDNSMIAFIVKTKNSDSEKQLSKKLEKDMETVIKDIKTFSKNKRKIPHYPRNFIDIRCNINIWDSLVEYQILKKYSNRYNADVEKVYDFISTSLSEHTCTQRPKQIMYVSIPIPVKVPVNVNDKIIEPIVSNSTLNSNQIPLETNDDKYIMIIDKINKKIQALNDFYENLSRNSNQKENRKKT